MKASCSFDTLLISTTLRVARHSPECIRRLVYSECFYSSVSDQAARPRSQGSLLSYRSKIFSSPPGSLVYQVPSKWIPLLVSRRQSGRNVKLDTHLHVVSSLNYLEICNFMLWDLIICTFNIVKDPVRTAQ